MTLEIRRIALLTLAAVMAAFILFTAVHYVTERGMRRDERQQQVQAQAVTIAAMLNKSPELERTAALLQALVKETGGALPVEAFIVAGEEEVRAAANPAEIKTPWTAVSERLAQSWPGFILVKVPLHRDPERPDKQTGELYVASPAASDPSLVPGFLAGLRNTAIFLVLLVPLLYVMYQYGFGPVAKIVEANRRSNTRDGYEMVRPGTLPPGLLRELVNHRNESLESLRHHEQELLVRTRDLENLFDFTRRVSISREVAQVPQLVLLSLAKSVPYEVACVLIFADSLRTLTVRSQSALTEFTSAEVERMAAAAHYKLSGVYLAGEKLEAHFTVNDPTAAMLDGKFRSTCWAAITLEQKPVGVMGLLALGENKFDAEEKRFLEIIAQITSLSLNDVPGEAKPPARQLRVATRRLDDEELPPEEGGGNDLDKRRRRNAG